jgi:hypothetical protein
VPALLALLDVPVDEASWQALDPLQRRQQTLDAVKRLLLRESVGKPPALPLPHQWVDMGRSRAPLTPLGGWPARAQPPVWAAEPGNPGVDLG